MYVCVHELCISLCIPNERCSWRPAQGLACRMELGKKIVCLLPLPSSTSSSSPPPSSSSSYNRRKCIVLLLLLLFFLFASLLYTTLMTMNLAGAANNNNNNVDYDCDTEAVQQQQQQQMYYYYSVLPFSKSNTNNIPVQPPPPPPPLILSNVIPLNYTAFKNANHFSNNRRSSKIKLMLNRNRESAGGGNAAISDDNQEDEDITATSSSSSSSTSVTALKRRRHLKSKLRKAKLIQQQQQHVNNNNGETTKRFKKEGGGTQRLEQLKIMKHFVTPYSMRPKRNYSRTRWRSKHSKITDNKIIENNNYLIHSGVVVKRNLQHDDLSDVGGNLTLKLQHKQQQQLKDNGDAKEASRNTTRVLLLPPSTSENHFNGEKLENNNSILRVKSNLTAARRRLPQALIIGVKKGGTRALLEFIRLHPDVRAVGPETHFFDRHYHKGLQWYREQLPPTLNGQLTMEKTPSYFVTREVPRRVLSMANDVKLLVVVRDPVTRAISDYAQTVSKRRHMRSFDQLAFLNNATGLVDTSWGAIKIGVYAKHLENWLQFFPLKQFHFVSGERLIKDPAGEMAKVQDFLGIRRIVTENHFYFNETKGFPCLKKAEGNGSPRCLGKTKGRTHPNVDNSTIQHLRDFFRPFNTKFYHMTGVDFCWP